MSGGLSQAGLGLVQEVVVSDTDDGSGSIRTTEGTGTVMKIPRMEMRAI